MRSFTAWDATPTGWLTTPTDWLTTPSDWLITPADWLTTPTDWLTTPTGRLGCWSDDNREDEIGDSPGEEVEKNDGGWSLGTAGWLEVGGDWLVAVLKDMARGGVVFLEDDVPAATAVDAGEGTVDSGEEDESAGLSDDPLENVPVGKLRWLDRAGWGGRGWVGVWTGATRKNNKQ